MDVPWFSPSWSVRRYIDRCADVQMYLESQEKITASFPELIQ